MKAKARDAAVGRNAPCPCGSGKKYKHCCAGKAQKTSFASRVGIGVIVVLLLGGAIIALTQIDDLDQERISPRRVWSEEHQHWH